MKLSTIATALMVSLALAACSNDADTTAESGGTASVEFAGIEDGATVASPVSVEFAAENFDIIPVAEGGGDGSGHMHVMVDVGCVAPGEVIPADDSHIHFGDGSTSADLELAAGEHTLCLQAGDAGHVALDVTDEITITVE